MPIRPTTRCFHEVLAAFAMLSAAPAAAQQWQWVVDRSMPGEFQGQMAYDEARERVVLFGCVNLVPGRNTPRSFTYEWDGERWMHRCTEVVQVRDMAVCYDSVRQRVVRTFGVYDGLPSSATWEWDGHTWTLRTPVGVLPRYRHAATFHAVSGCVLAFGGTGLIVPFLGETLQLAGTMWTTGTPAVTPPLRYGHGMAYDSMRQRSVLFGGASPGTLRNDTWEWDGLAWQPRLPANKPSVRHAAALAYDPQRARMVLFGGRGGLADYADTWEWDGTNWQQIVTAHAPSPRAWAAMVCDRAAGRLLLHGGTSDCCYRHSDTWCYDGVDWRLLLPDAGPTRRSHPALVHDFFRGRSVRNAVWVARNLPDGGQRLPTGVCGRARTLTRW